MIGRSGLALVALCFAVAAGCGGGSSTPQPPPPPPPSFSISFSPPSITLNPGMGLAVTIQCNAKNGFSAPVAFTIDVPNGISVSPSAFNMSTCSSEQVMFTAADSEAAQQIEIPVHATSGSISQAGQFELDVVAYSPPPTLAGYVRLESQPYSVVYDTARDCVYAAITELNRVEVISVSSRKVVASIPVQQPVAMDLSVDGSVLYVGEGSGDGFFAVGFISLIDLNRLEVVQRVPTPPVNVNGATVDNYLRPLALSNGTVFWSAGTFGSQVVLVQWNPVQNTWKGRAEISFAPSFMMRSADGSRAIIQSGSDIVVLYDTSTDTFRQTNNSTISTLSRRGDVIATVYDTTLRWYDASLNQLGTIDLGVRPDSIVYSPDDSLLFVVHDMVADLYETVNYTRIGYAPRTVVVGSMRPNFWTPVPVSNSGILFETALYGLALTDTSARVTDPNAYPVISFPTPTCGAPGTPVRLSIPTSRQSLDIPRVFFDNLEGTDVSMSPGMIQVTTPGVPTPHAAVVSATFPDGWVAVAPDIYSFGPELAIPPGINGAPPQPSSLDGFWGWFMGFGLFSPQTLPQILIGGTPAQMVNTRESGLMFASENIYFTPPQGTIGKQDITLNSPCGTATMRQAFEYVKTTVVPVAASIAQGVYDSQRNRVYFTDAARILVLSSDTYQWLSPITLAGDPSKMSLAGLTLTVDGSRLIVADHGQSLAYVLDPDNPADVWSIDTKQGSQLDGSYSLLSLAATAHNKVIVYHSFAGSGCTRGLRIIDLATRSVSDLPNPPNCVPESGLLHGTTDGSRSYFGSQGTYVSFDADGKVLDAKTLVVYGGWDSTVAGDGNRVVESLTLADGQFRIEGRVRTANTITDGGRSINFPAQYVFGEKLDVSGSVFYWPLDRALEIFDANTGRLKKCILLPEVAQTVLDGMVLDASGRRAFIVTASGITVVDLGDAPIGIGSTSPIGGVSGTLVTVRGSGFKPNTQVQVDSIAATVNFVDEHTLQFVIPVGTHGGGVRLTASNADGQSTFLDAAIFVN